MFGPGLFLRILTAAGLAVSSYIHFDLAEAYATNGADISQGTLFRVQASVAALAAVLVLITAHRAVTALALVVSAASLAAVVASVYVDLGAIGPFPNMYEPAWYGDKTISAIAEAVSTVTAAAAMLVSRHRTARDAATA
ncbi:hypothetical protein [Actinokineospora xionganensis]|uniref:Integral membrane protein n=1 Tax=Actinokineospora xionganensis TaxID=2684470 RepID=A0ABR7L472_9PSEU|nr:hypothetical protein [Actinokineospora xionganensis]MBC6447482.1 hypothetical protein [Actinokineospora xionganensis]